MASILDGLKRFEGDTTFLYVDDRGFVTCGIGEKIPNVDAALTLPWFHKDTDVPASVDEIRVAFATVAAAPAGHRDSFYAALSDLRLPAAFPGAHAQERLDSEFLPGLRRQFAGWDDYPVQVQAALIDMAYNLGIGGIGKFDELHKACAAGDWEWAARESHRSTCRPERNDWTAAQFRSAIVTAPAA